MRNRFIIALILWGSTLFSLTLPLKAQQPPSSGAGVAPAASPPIKDVYFVNRAKNLARQAAIKANGGLEKYRPDPIMYGPAVQTPYKENADGSVTFTFKGGMPGATPSVETVATVRPDGLVTLDYNGSIRGASGGGVELPATPPAPPTSTSTPPSVAAGTPPSPKTPTTGNPGAPPPPQPARPGIAWADEDSFLTRARNLARQAAINANGGLGKYRPEAKMFGPAAKSPHTKNQDGSLTFTFKGGIPGAEQLTLESVINVSRTGTVAVQYNGPVRSP
jgi:hypothetical protein